MTDLAAALREFRFRDEIGRYELFLELYGGHGGRGSVLEQALAAGDVLMKNLLLRYLEEIPEPRAVELFLRSLEDPDESVRKAAQRAYERNHFLGKANLLRPFVLSAALPAARFAIRTLARGGDEGILPALLRELPGAQGELRLEMLDALRFLPDQRSVPLLCPLASDPEEPVRFRALRCLGEIRGRGLRVPPEGLLAAAADASERIRSAALAGLRHFSDDEVGSLFLARALSAAEPLEARLSALRALPTFPRGEWIEPLLALRTQDIPPELRLTTEMALRRFPAELLREGLCALLDHRDPGLSHQAALLLADCLADDEEVRERLLERWRAAKDLSARLKMLGVFRELGDRDIIPVLLDALRESRALAYGSVGVLNRLFTRGDCRRVLGLLVDGGLPDVSKQSLLTGLVQRGPDETAAEELFAWLIDGLRHPVTNIRYLSMQVLAWYPFERFLPALLGSLAGESDPQTIKLAYSLILRGLGDDPLPLAAAVGLHPERPRLTGRLCELLGQGYWDPERAFALLYALIRDPLRLHETAPGSLVDLCLRLLLSGVLPLERIWLFLPRDELRRAWLESVREGLRAAPAPPRLPLDFLGFHLAGADPASRLLLYELAALDGRPEGIPLLTRWLIAERDPAALARGRELLRRLIWEAGA